VDGVTSAAATVDYTVPAFPEIAAPQFTSPANNATVPTGSVTFTGTGIPGQLIQVFVYHADSAHVDPMPTDDVWRLALPFDEPHPPGLRIGVSVAADGTWEQTIRLKDAVDYVAVVAHVQNVPEWNNWVLLSDIGDVLRFRLQTSSGLATLPETGATLEPMSSLTATASILLGGMLLVVARGRTRRVLPASR
jgi:hypothetical protein